MLDRGVRDLRIGFVRHFHELDKPAHPEVTAAVEDAARVLQAEGAEVRTVTLAVAERIRRGQSGDPVQRGLVDPRAVAARASRRLWPARHASG